MPDHQGRLVSDISVTETYLTQLNNARSTISLFDVSWTFSILKSDLGLKVNYQNGRLEATGQATRQ